MFTLVIEASFKPGKRPEFLEYWKNEILPVQKKQSGFVDEIVMFANNDPNHGLGLSIWETKQEAEDYHRNIFPRLAAGVVPLCEKQPVVREYTVEVAETFDITEEAA